MDLARAAAEGDRGGAAIAGVGWLVAWLVGWLWLGSGQSVNQSISFAVLRLLIVSRILSTSAKEGEHGWYM